LVAELLLWALALAGCTSGAQSPGPVDLPVPDPATTVQTPAASPEPDSGPASDTAPPGQPPAPIPGLGEPPCRPSAEVDVRPFGQFEVNAVTEGLCTAVAPAEETWVIFRFPPGLPEDTIRSSLAVSGSEYVLRDFTGEQLTVYLAPAQPGTETIVRLRGPVGEGGAQADLGFRLLREASPNVTVEVQAGEGPWRPHEPGEYLPAGPARVRVTFSHPLSPHGARQAEDAFEWPLVAVRKDREPIPYQLSWDGPRTLVVDLPQPPPALFVDLRWIQDERGLTTRSGILNLHAGEPPRFRALDPATGREEDLGPAPVDIWWTQLSPDGRWVVMEALRPDSPYEMDVWLIDTATGEALKTDLLESPYIDGYHWFPDRLVVAGWEKLQEWDLTRHALRVLPARASYAGPLSPDGRYLAGRILHGDEDPETWLAPLTVAVYDLATETERLYPEVGNWRVPHRGGGVPVNVPMRWADDGQSLYVLQWAEDAPYTDSKWHWAVLDLETGIMTPAREDELPGDPFLYPASEPRPVEGASGWAFTRADWGTVTLFDPGGKAASCGEGLPLAWMADGRLLLVRWPDYAHRRDPGW